MPQPTPDKAGDRKAAAELIRTYSEELLKRRSIKEQFRSWCEHALAPMGLTPARHHLKLIELLQQISDGTIKRLIVMMPPGSAKSTFSSQLFPAYWMIHHPNTKIIAGSNTERLSTSFSRMVRSHVINNSAVLGYKLDETQTSVSEWGTSNGCQYLAVGSEGSVLGNRADCLLGSTIVHTDVGDLPLSEIYTQRPSISVASYDFISQQVVYRRVVAVARRSAGGYYRIRTAAGRVVEATAEHRIWANGRWVEARALSVGDTFVRALPSRVLDAGVGVSQIFEGPADPSVVLRPSVWHGGEQRGSRFPNPMLHQLPAAPVGKTPGWSERELLLSGVCAGSVAGRGTASPDGAGTPLRGLQRGVSADHEHLSEPLLQPAVRQRGAFTGDEGHGQSRLAGRRGRATAGPSVLERVSASAPQGDGTRQLLLRGVPLDQAVARASYRSGHEEQQPGKSGDIVPGMSSQIACGRAFETVGDVVAMVEYVCEQTDVFDVQIDGTECFFANDILVHNCLIIDDPYKSRADAANDTRREAVLNWYSNDLLSRLKPEGRILIIMTRFHQDDLVGRLLEIEPDNWTVVKFTAVCDDPEHDPLQRELGELLWPDYQTAEHYEEKRRIGGEMDWASNYMQAPKPAGGNLFNITFLEGNMHLTPPSDLVQTVRAWDLAGRVDDGDYTVGLKLGRRLDGRFVILDVTRFRAEPAKVEETILHIANLDGHATRIALSQDPGQAGKSQIGYLTRQLAGFTVLSERETGSKVVRATPVASQVNAGNFALVYGTWNRQFLDEMSHYPSSRYDDQIDALARAFQVISVPVAQARIAHFDFMAR